MNGGERDAVMAMLPQRLTALNGGAASYKG
jgi:hypothetical protein